MKVRCYDCHGKGFHEDVETCPDCKGTGSLDLVIGIGESKGKNCETCQGEGKLVDKYKCETCDGEGNLVYCAICGNELEDDDAFLCSTCEENPVVIRLAQPLDQKYLGGKRALAGRVISADGREIVVDLGAGFKGSFQPKGVYYNVGQTVPVRLKSPINPKERSKRPYYVIPINLKEKDFKVVDKHLPVEDLTVNQISTDVGKVGRLTVQVSDIFVVPNGPTLYTVVDEEGTNIQASAYGEDNSQAYPRISRSTVVHMVGRFRYYNEQKRIQVYSMEKTKANEAFVFMDKLSGINQEDGSKLEDLSFYVQSEVYDSLKEQFVKAAKRIRQAVLNGQNIILRYHVTGIDGTTGAYALDFAIRRYLATRGAKRDDFRRALRKLPHRGVTFSVADIARDLSFALDDTGSQYHNLPLYVLINVGSSEEALAALDFCRSYEVDTIIIDDQIPAEEIQDKSYAVINPNLVTDVANVSSGMLAAELAKFVSAEQDIANRVTHLAAISGVANRIEGNEVDQYLKLAEENEFDNVKIENIKFALEYIVFGLRHLDGGEVTRNILGISGPRSRTDQLIESITPTAKSLFTKALKVMNAHAEKTDLPNNKTLYSIDLENYAPRFEYPPHSELLIDFHINQVENSDEAVVTIGSSQSYMIIRSSDINFSFASFLEDLQSKLPDFGITGSGSSTAGSIQFYSGHKETVYESVKTILGE